MTDFRDAGAGDQSNIAGAENADFHGLFLLACRLFDASPTRSSLGPLRTRLQESMTSRRLAY
jgi:hypothetical protein